MEQINNNNIIEYVNNNKFLMHMKISEIESHILNFVNIYDLKHFYGDFDEDNEQLIFSLESKLLRQILNLKCSNNIL